MAKEMDTDLLPWILGGLAIAIGAAAMVIASTGRHASASAPAISPAHVAVQTPDMAAPATQTPIASQAAVAAQTPATTQPTSQSALAPGQVWQCMINGQKIFSDKPCGDHPTVRQLNQVNTMEATQGAPTAPYDSYDSGYTPSTDDQDTQTPENDAYVYGGVNLARERMRRAHAAGRGAHEHDHDHEHDHAHGQGQGQAHGHGHPNAPPH